MMTLATIQRALITFLLFAQLSACGGWQLRGTYEQVAASKARIYLSGGTPELRAEILRQANLSSLNISTSQQDADLTIKITSDLNRRRIYTVGVNEQPTEFLLIYAIKASAEKNTEVLFASEEMRRERIIRYDSENPLVGDNEAQIVINELRKELANQLLFRSVKLYRQGQ